MKKLFLSAAAALSLFCGCTVIRQTPEVPADIKQKENEYQLGRELLKAFLKDDSKRFVSILTPPQRKEFDLKKFSDSRKAIIDSLGDPISFRYVTSLEMTVVTPQIWAVRFRRQSKKDGKTYYSEILFRVITGMINGKPSVIGFNFQ